MTYSITQDVLDQIQDELANYMDDVYEPRTDYTGRGMYGQACVGWVYDESELRFATALLLAIIQVAKDNKSSDSKLLQIARQEDWWELTHFIGGGKTDNMGRNAITYFPDLTFEAGQ